ncbi:hypothetical protein JCM11641_002808 [Rhodosporidiobolus odoratus]
MVASATITTTSYQPGKAPLLFESSRAGITAFLRAAWLFFRTKSVREDEDKIAYLGAGLQHFPELYNWYLSSVTVHEAKAYVTFVADLQRRAMPRDYVWEAKGRIRWARQGEMDYEDWVEELRTEHLSLTEKILSTRGFIECILYGMDVELSTTLRAGNVLKNSGFHQDDLTSLALSSTPLAFTAPLDYERFDREARDEWNKIKSRGHSNVQQLKSLNKKTASLTVSSPSSRSTFSNVRSSSPKVASNVTSTSATTVSSTTQGGCRPPKLTDLERDWLSANKGCFRCRQPNTDHEAVDCTTWPPNDYVVPVPVGWTKDSAATSVTTTGGKVGVRGIHSYSDEEIDLPESRGLGFRCLASRLGLERQKLSRPKTYQLVIEGGDEIKQITEFVRALLHLANGAWSAGLTTLLVAPLEDPYGISLGTPFLRQHRIVIDFSDDPKLLISQEAPLEPLDLYADVEGPMTQVERMEAMEEGERGEVIGAAMETLIARVEAKTEEEKEMAERAALVMADYQDLFPDVLPALTRDYLERTRTGHKIKFVDSSKTRNQRGFSVPRKWRERWKKMLDEHIAAGRLRSSTSPFASAAFIIPKKDPQADPRWVNDYRHLNSNTVKDRTPLPVPDVVLSDAALAKYWGKIDMTNAFFQTPMDKDDIAKTAIKTPWGLFEGTVMPQGLCIAPATHQACVNKALRHLVGVCCQAFVDDIIIYSSTLDEHEKNCRAVLDAL